MNDRKLFLFLTFLPLLMALFFWDLETNLSSIPEPQTRVNIDEIPPSSIVEKAQLSQFNQEGILSQKIESPKLSYTNQTKIMAINSPAIQIQGQESNWLATSNTGEFNQLNEQFSLIGNVELVQNSNNPSVAPIKMSTEQLKYYSETQVVETDIAVLIETKGHIIESLGMHFDIANSIFILTDQVRSTHEPMSLR